VPALLYGCWLDTVELRLRGQRRRPSALDLSTAGGWIGAQETRFQLWRAAKRIDDSRWRGVFTSLLDPLGELRRVIGTPFN
jgi:hypothetical protein